MIIYLASSYISAHKKLAKKNLRLSQKIKEKILIFQENPTHPTLKLHKLQGGPYSNWSFSVAEDIRIIFSYVEDGVIFVDIGKHEDVY